jgi:regulation of enolase protein 1 (concanavalin A-like superfamily)
VVSVSASDGAGNPASRTFGVTVSPWNSAPVLAALGNRTVEQGATLSFNATATDADLPGQTLAYSLDAGAPAGTSINAASGEFSWSVPSEQSPGDYQVTVRVTDNGSPAKDDFETITITVTTALPAPWLEDDIGTVGLAGSADYDSGTYTIGGAGTGVHASADGFHFVHQNASGDCEAIIKVESLTNPSASAKAGVMIRETLAANSRCAGVYVTPSAGIQFIYRSSTGSTVSVFTKTGLTAPCWVRVKRAGSKFSAYHSSDGSTWTQLSNNKTITMSSSVQIGMAVTSGTTSATATAVLTGESSTP